MPETKNTTQNTSTDQTGGFSNVNSGSTSATQGGANSFTNTNNPWAPQVPGLTTAFDSALGLYNNARGNVYGGPLIAQATPDQLGLYQKMMSFANNNGTPDAMGIAGSGLTSAGQGGITGALNSLASFKPSGGAQDNINNAGMYADNPYISGMVDASMRDVDRQAHEQTMPGIDRAAALTGNINSNRRDIAQGLVQRGLDDQRGDISAQLRSAAYNHGLDLSENGRQFDNNALLQSIMGRGSLGSGVAGMGIGALGSSMDQYGKLFGIGTAGAQGGYQANQTALDANRAQSEYGPSQGFQLLQQLLGITSGNYGGTQSGSSVNNTSNSSVSSALSNGSNFSNSIGVGSGTETKQASPVTQFATILNALGAVI